MFRNESSHHVWFPTREYRCGHNQQRCVISVGITDVLSFSCSSHASSRWQRWKTPRSGLFGIDWLYLSVLPYVVEPLPSTLCLIPTGSRCWHLPASHDQLQQVAADWGESTCFPWYVRSGDCLWCMRILFAGTSLLNRAHRCRAFW